MSLLPHVERVIGIRDGRFSAPVMVDVTPVDGICNLSCRWCCQAHSRNSHAARFMAAETIERLGPFCRDWGVLAWRVSGEADPCLHKSISDIIASGAGAGIDVGLISNGVFLERVLNAEDLHYVGVSLDAATAETWHSFKGGAPGDFEKIIDNIARLRSRQPSLDISIKFLKVDRESMLDDEFWSGARSSAEDDRLSSNAHEIEAAEALAKRLGVRFILKSAYTSGSRPKFSRCLVTPLGGVFDAYHRFHLCCDARGKYMLTDDYTRDDWQELLSLWGGPRHKALIDSIQPRACPACAKEQANSELARFFGGRQLSFI